MIALVLAAAVAASDAPLGAVDMAATVAKVQADMKRICPWVPIKVVECNNALPCAKAELKRVMELHNRCNDSIRRILACTASGVPVDVCKQGMM